MATNDKTVRVFISSTFRDMHAERDHLVTVVFPELRERLAQLRLDFYDVDLRWGVPEHDADGERANSWAYCKKWIDRVEPFFICIMGQRYGWIPPESEIRDKIDRLTYRGLSITEMEVRYAVLDEKLRKRSLFYLRATQVPTNVTDVAPEVYKRFVDASEQTRLEDLKKRIRASGQPVYDYSANWSGDSFAGLEAFGERVLEDLWSGILRDERYVSKEAWRKALECDPDQDRRYTDKATLIEEAVWKEIVRAAKPTPKDPLNAEVEAMATFAEARVRWFQGRQQELDALLEFVAGDVLSDASRLCVVAAEAGAGKSALLARLTLELANSCDLIIAHFVGATELSADPRKLVGRLVQELDRANVPHPEQEDADEDLETQRRKLAARLENYAGSRRIVILIDGINQLLTGHDLNWLPQRFGPQVRIVISTLDGTPATTPTTPAARALAALRSRWPSSLWSKVSPLTEANVRAIIQEYLDDYCKELDRAELDAIAALPQARNPLYLRVLLDELRTLGSNDLRLMARLAAETGPGPDVHEIMPAVIGRLRDERPDTVALFDWVLSRLEVFGQEEVRLWCIYLALGRNGMSSRELCGLLARRIGPEAARVALRIERGLRRYLQHLGPQLNFFHGQLRTAVERRYLPANPMPYHADVAAYYDAQPAWCLDGRIPEPNKRKVSEQIYHMLNASAASQQLGRLIADLSFVAAKCTAGMAADLLDECDLAKSTAHHDEFEATRGLIASCLGSLMSRPEYAAQTLYNSLRLGPDLAPQLGLQLSGLSCLLERNPCWISVESSTLPAATLELRFDRPMPVQYCDENAGWLYCADETGQVVAYDMKNGKEKERRQLSVPRVSGLTMCQDVEQLAFQTADGLVALEHGQVCFQGRTRDSIIAWHAACGLVGVRNDDMLVAWDTTSHTISEIAPRLEAPLLFLRISREGSHILFGGGHTRQVLGVASRHGTLWRVLMLNLGDIQVVDGDLDVEAGVILLVARDRRLQLYDLANGALQQEFRYQARATESISGPPRRCRLGRWGARRAAYVITFADQAGVWQYEQGGWTRLADLTSRPVTTLSILPQNVLPGNIPLCTTPTEARSLRVNVSPEPELPVGITRCLLIGNTCVLAWSYVSKTCTEIALDGTARLLARFAVPKLSALATDTSGRHALLGDQSGNVWRLVPGEVPGEANCLPVGHQPVAALVAGEDGQILVAETTGGVRRLSAGEAEPATVLPSSVFQVQKTILPAPAAGAVWRVSTSTIEPRECKITLLQRDGSESTGYTCGKAPVGVVANEDGSTLGLIMPGRVLILRAVDGHLVESLSRDVEVTDIRFAGDGQWLAVALPHRRWLEVWQLAPGLPTFSALSLPGEAACLCAQGNTLAIGFHDAPMLLLRLHIRSMEENTAQ